MSRKKAAPGSSQHLYKTESVRYVSIGQKGKADPVRPVGRQAGCRRTKKAVEDAAFKSPLPQITTDRLCAEGFLELRFVIAAERTDKRDPHHFSFSSVSAVMQASR